MNRLLTLTIVALLGIFGDARHIHPSENRDDMDISVLKSRVIERVPNVSIFFNKYKDRKIVFVLVESDIFLGTS